MIFNTRLRSVPTSTPAMAIIGAMLTPTATPTITMATMLMGWPRIRRLFGYIQSNHMAKIIVHGMSRRRM